MSIGERLKQWRISNNLKTTEISAKTGVSTGGLSEYENDKKLIGSKTLISLYREFDIDIGWILTGKESKELDLTENEKELLENFKELPDREQIKFIGKIEDIALKYKNIEKEENSSSSKIG